jgi:NAD(P)-dependent dehydrogenase (short-subunit alcohol dehydrogenase family)
MRKVLITGGTGNIGTQLVKEMIADGHFVLFTTRAIVNGEQLVEKLQLPSDRCIPIELEFGDENALQNLANQLTDLPDVVIHNARSLKTLKIDNNGRISEQQFQEEFYNGVVFPYQITNLLLDLNAPLKDVIFISSMYGSVAPTPSLYNDFDRQSPINYGVVKAAQIHFVKELAVRLSRKNIRANAISYGGVEGRVNNDFKNRYSKLVPSGRMLNHTDLYPPLKYLLDYPKLNITGENLKVDGGWTIW